MAFAKGGWNEKGRKFPIFSFAASDLKLGTVVKALARRAARIDHEREVHGRRGAIKRKPELPKP